MTIEENKALVRRFIDEVFVAGSFTAVDELVAEDFMPHTWGSMGSGRQALKEAITRVSAGLTDVSMTVEDLFGEGDKVVVRLTSRAVQSGVFMGLPPSGRAYAIGEIQIFGIRDGKVSEHWHEADFIGMLRQLGAMPEHS